MRDEMTPRQRIEAFLAGKKPDRVPCVPLILNHAARVIGEPVGRYGRDGEVMGRAQVAAYRRYGQDLITIFSDTSILAEAMGSQLTFLEDDVSRMKTPVVSQSGELGSLQGVDVKKSGRLGEHLRAVRHCVKEVGDEVLVSFCYPAPFSTAAGLRGTAQLARDLYKNPDLARTLLQESLTVVKDYASAIVEAGGIPVLVDPVASGSVLSRKAFEDFVMPTLREALAHIRSLGLPPILHICGRSSTIIDLMADSGAAVLSIDQIDLAEAVAKVGNRVCLMGNVKPAQTLLEGNPHTIREEAARCLAVGLKSPGGFILASGCEVPIETPPENVLAMLAAVRGS